MNSCIPLCKQSASCSILTVEGKSIPCTLGGWGKYFFVASPSFLSIFYYINDQKCQLLGKLFFRSTETGEKCSILTCNYQLADFSTDFVFQDPRISPDPEAMVRKSNLITFYHLHLNRLVITSASGHITVLLLDPNGVKGCVLPFVFPYISPKWIGSAMDCCIIGFSDSHVALIQCIGCVSHVYTSDSTDYEFRFSPSVVDFFRPSPQGDFYVVDFFFNGTQESLELWTKPHGKLEIKQIGESRVVETLFHLIEILFLRTMPFISYTVFIAQDEITVWCEFYNVVLPPITIFSLSCTPYSCGFKFSSDEETLKGYFCVCRVDGVFEYYSICLDPLSSELKLKKEFTGNLPSGTTSIGICMKRLLFLVISNERSHILELTKIGTVAEVHIDKQDENGIVLIELALVGENEYGLCYLSRNGVCTLVTDKRKVDVAHVLHPENVSTLLAVETNQSLMCLLGSSCGSVLFFKNNILLAEDLCSHFEALSSITVLENFVSFGSLFISTSITGRTLSLHGGNGEKIFVASQNSPIMGYDVEASKGLLFLYSCNEVSGWRISDGKMEWASAYSLSSQIYKIWRPSLNRGLRLIHQRFCDEAQCSFSISVKHLIDSLKKTNSVSREFNVALTLVLGSCALCMNKYPLNEKFMHVVDQMSLCVLPTMSLENYLNAIKMEAALFDYSSQKHHSIQACESISSLVTGLVSKFSLAVPEHSLLVYYQNFQHWSCFPFTLCRVYFAYMVNVVSRIDMVKRFAQVLGRSVGEEDDELVDFIGFSLTVASFRGFVSAALPVWKCAFEGSREVEMISEILSTQAKQTIQALGRSTLADVDSQLRSLACVCETFWLEKDDVEKKQWLCKLFELLSMRVTSQVTKDLCNVILERIASCDVYHFYSYYLPWIFTEKPLWRKTLAELQKKLMTKYCLETYNAPYPLFKLLTHLYDAKVSKLEKQENIEQILDVMACAAAILPNVAFHRSCLTLAVGLRDGCAHIRQLSSNTADSFVAHQDAILCIACNEFAVNCQEIATISEKMHHIKLWRTKQNNNNFLTDLLFSSSSPAKLSRFKTILLKPPDPEVTALFSQFINLQSSKDGSSFMHPCPFYLRCELKWTDYKTLQLSTPWSGTKEFSV